MKFLNNILKLPILLFAQVIKKSPASLKFLFTKALKNEIIDFNDSQYFSGYFHIEKTIKLAKEFNLINEIVIDVGGADGTTAKMFLEAFPKSKIFVFEPLKENYSQIAQILNQYINLKLIKKAVGSSPQKAVIHKTKRITSSSLLEVNSDSTSEVFSDILKVNDKVEVSITTLDESIPQNEFISILKIDVQGYELEVLKGATSTLRRTSIIVLEMNNHSYYSGAPKYYEVDIYLRENDFILYDIFPSTKDKGQLKEWDSIYVKVDLLK